ncbi:MAG: hypothetical protein OXP28_12345 [Gammaproteobacteria bacterium]|nr:hypothetical protein [Gammaproteobacteria bacterium]
MTQASRVKKLTASVAHIEVSPPRLQWMGHSRQWGTRVKKGEHGLRLGDLNVGIYGEIPQHWEDQSRRPRGAADLPGMPPLPYHLRSKHQVWADSAADLYEEAIQHRWIPATDIPWRELSALPDDVERAMCQVLTELMQAANAELESITYWQEQMSYGYHEVKQFLAVAALTCARHIDAFRKRCLANGGGLGLESRGRMNRAILESRGGWTEAVVYIYLLRGFYVQNQYRLLLAHAHNAAEREIFANCLADHSRHMSYALDHLKYAITQQDGQAAIIQTLLSLGESTLARDIQEPVQRSALAVVFGGGVEGGRQEGMATWHAMVRQSIHDYLDACEWLGIKRNMIQRRLNALLPPDEQLVPPERG